MTNQAQFKVSDSIATDDDGYAKAILSQIEFDQYLNDETGEITEQILFVWDTLTRKGKETKIRFWTSMNISPVPRKVNGKVSFNPLTTLLLMHQIISVADLSKLAKDETYIDQMDIALDKMIGVNHKFKLDIKENGLAKPNFSTFKISKAISVGVEKPNAEEETDDE